MLDRSMQHNIPDRLALFVANAQIIRKEFTSKHSQTRRLAALLYAQENKPIDCEAIRRCHALIREHTGPFSSFRGELSLCVATLLSLSPDPQRLFDEALKVYDLLKDAKFRACDYLVIAAWLIAARSDPSNYPNVVNRMRAFYDSMKAYHSLKIGQDDYISAAILGLSDLDVTEGAGRIEQIYSRLKGEFRDRNSILVLSQALALSSDDEVVNRVMALRDALKARKIRLDKSLSLPILGVLALLPVEIDAIVRDIGETRDSLRTQKWFGSMSVSTQELLVFAAAVVAGACMDTLEDGVLTATLSGNIAGIIIMQQAAMIAAIAAAGAVAAASSSGH